MNVKDYDNYKAYCEGEFPYWKDDAKCKDLGPDVFFPTSEVEEKARVDFCYDCPVRIDCLEFAVATDQNVGPSIWGGMTSKQRDRVKRYVRRSLNKHDPPTAKEMSNVSRAQLLKIVKEGFPSKGSGRKRKANVAVGTQKA